MAVANAFDPTGLARLIESSDDLIIVSDAETGIVLWSKGCAQLYGYAAADVIGRSSLDLLQKQSPHLHSSIKNALAETGHWDGEVLVRTKDGRSIWVQGRFSMVQQGDRCLILESHANSSARRKSDAIQVLMSGELLHRVNNTLATVQAIVSQTAQSSVTVEQFVAKFNSRLRSLSSAYGLLMEAKGTGASIRGLIASQLTPLLGDMKRISLRGDEIVLPPQSALNLALILHELAVNALTHGALSSRFGEVTLSWNIETISWNSEEIEPRKLDLVWRETGGPPVVGGEHRGFGRRLIESTRAFPHTGSRLSFEPAGIVCHIQILLRANNDAELFDFARA